MDTCTHSAVVVEESLDHHALVRDRRGNGPVRSADRDLVVSIDRAHQAAAVGCGNRFTRHVPDAGRPRWIQGGCSTCWVIRSSSVARSTTSCAQWLPLRKRREVVVDPVVAGGDVELVDVAVGADEVDVHAVVGAPVAVERGVGRGCHGAGNAVRSLSTQLLPGAM